MAGNMIPKISPLLIILLGPPGAGKGTHAPDLGSHFMIPHISTGDLFRQNIREKTLIGLKAQGFIDQGKLVPDDIVLEMLFSRLMLEDCKRGAVLDGVPRTIDQAIAIDQKLGGNYRLSVLLLMLEEALLFERICGRIGCKQCGKPFHKKYDSPKNNLCACGGTLIRRDDDSEEVLKKRLEVYHSQTEPLIEHYKPILHEIDAGQPRHDVFNHMTKALSYETVHA
ncbi:MAG TPA: nucleoside monophosphate kinase [Chlamydiales bacterium]|nr:nucleoside monophosphate kinase [Chlamydiales bacterium]